jgi:hypothetical protein
MAENNNQPNSTSFIVIGLCFTCAGVALGIGLFSRGAYGIGLAIVGLGLMFVAIGLARRRQS